MTRNIWKKILTVLLSVACICILTPAVGCTQETNEGVDVGGKEEIKLELNYRYYTLEIYDNITLTPIIQETEGTLVWSSSNTSIAVVDENGYVEGVGTGEATITALVGNDIATCRIIVSDNGLIPDLLVGDKEISVANKTEYTLSPVLQYNGKAVSGTEFTYKSSNENILTVENGTIRGVSYGTATVNISTKWKHSNEAFTTAVKVTIVPNVGLRISNAHDLTIYTLDRLNGVSYGVEKEIKYEVTLDGVALNVAPTDIEWSIANDKIATVEDGLLTAVNAGTTNVRLDYSLTVDGEEYPLTTSATVAVVRPVVEVTEELLVDTWTDVNAERDKTKIALVGEDIFGEDLEVVQVLDQATGKIYDLVNGAFQKGEKPDLGKRTWTVYNTKYGYSMPAYVASMVIKNANDLMLLSDLFDNGLKDGYYVLDNDVNFLGNSFGAKGRALFQGTIDGRGHTITNIQVFQGMVYQMGVHGVIKNLGLLNVSVTSYNESGVFVSTCLGTLENVFASGVSNGSVSAGAFAFRLYEGAEIINSTAILNYNGAGEIATSCGAFAAEVYSMVTLTDSYVITNTYGGVDGNRYGGDNVVENANKMRVAIYETLAEMSTGQKATNTFLANNTLRLSVERNELLGYTAISSSLPVVWNVEEVDGVTFENGVLATESTTPIQVSVTAISLIDDTVRLTEKVSVVKIAPQIISRANANALLLVDDCYEVELSDEIEAESVIWAVLGRDLYKKYDNLNVNTLKNSIMLPCSTLTDGVNTLYVCTDSGYYQMPVRLSIPDTTLLDSTAISGNIDAESYSVALGDKLQAEDVRWVIAANDLFARYEDLQINVTENTIDVPATAFIDGQCTLYIGTNDECYSIVVKNFLRSQGISSSTEFVSAVTDNTKTYYLTKDIDLEGITFDGTMDFVGKIDGNGYAIKNLTFETVSAFDDMSGSLTNVAVYANAKGDNVILFYRMLDGANMENTYVRLNVDLANCEKSVTRLFYQTHASKTENLGTGRLTNVIFEVIYKNAGESVKSYSSTILNHFEWLNVNMTNVYAINEKAFARLLNERWGANATLTVQNGKDEAYAVDKNTEAVDLGANYGFTTMSRFYRSDYRFTFTADIWKDIIVFDETNFWAGYTKISTAQELATALVSSARVKYYLANDIDMTGVSLSSSTAQFGGELEGDGHKVTGISYTTNYFMGYLEGTIKNVSFYATRVVPTGVTVAESAFISSLQKSTLENVYIDLTIDVNGASATLHGGVFMQHHNSSAVVTMTNVIGNVHFVNSGNATIGEFGFLWRMQGGTLNMTNVYAIGTQYKTGAEIANPRLVYTISKVTTLYARTITISNGVDDTITVKEETGVAKTPTELNGKYFYKDLATFKASSYAQYLLGSVWESLLGN